MSDLRHTLRQLHRHPFSNAVIVLTIALLIGTVSVLYAKMRDAEAEYAPFPERGRMVKLWRLGGKGIVYHFSADLAREYARHLQSYDEFGLLKHDARMTLTEAGEPVSCQVVNVSASLLRLAGVQPLRGRLLDEGDEIGGESILLRERIWRENFQAEDGLPGRTVRLNGRAFTVVGILPDALHNTHLAYGADVWRATRFDDRRDAVELAFFARLKPGVTRRQAQAELDAIAPALEKDRPLGRYERLQAPDGILGARVVPFDQQREPLGYGISREALLVGLFLGTILASVVGIACFNVANLLLVRVAARARELAIRASLGAGRARIAAHILTETVLLSMLGGAVGLLVSFWLIEWLRLEHVSVRLDWRLYVLTAGGSLGLGVLMGLIPALWCTRLNVNAILKDSSSTVGGRRRHRLRNFLVASQVAMALILCVVTGLLVQSYTRLHRGEMGFDPARVVALGVEFREDTYREPADSFAYAKRAVAVLRQIPGMQEIGVAPNHGLMAHQGPGQIWLQGSGREPVEIAAVVYHANPGYTRVSGMPLLRGRELSDDFDRARNEAVVNETFVRRFLLDRDPVGHQLRTGLEVPGSPWATIVGVVRDRHPATTPMSTQPEVVVGLQRATHARSLILLVQTRPPGRSMAPALRQALQGVDAGQPVPPPLIFGDLLTERIAGIRKVMQVLGGIAGVGLVIALLGVYGVVAFTVAERTREVGIRMAMGASRSKVLRLILWQGARLMLMGAVPGLLIGSAVVAGLPADDVFGGVSAFDPVTLLVILCLVGGAGFLASALPARRAANLNPMEALRHE
jgi:putative ABC transport system permease protein